jgi:hypothetical protein
VENGYNGVIVGAVAQFRFCDPRYVGMQTKEECKQRFVALDETSQIPQGGFVVSASVHRYLKDNDLLRKLQTAWKASVRETHTAGGAEGAVVSADKYLPETWGGVSSQDYATARKVLGSEDAADPSLGNISQKLVITGVVIILLVSVLILWLRRPARQKGQS